MDKKFLLALLAGSVTLFVVGFILYVIAFGGFFADHVGSATGVAKDEASMNILAIFLGNVAAAAMLTIIFGKWGSIRTLADGAKAGAIFGFLVALSFDLVMFGTTNMADLTSTLVEPFVSAVMFAVGGGVIGMMLGRGDATESDS